MDTTSLLSFVRIFFELTTVIGRTGGESESEEEEEDDDDDDDERPRLRVNILCRF